MAGNAVAAIATDAVFASNPENQLSCSDSNAHTYYIASKHIRFTVLHKPIKFKLYNIFSHRMRE